jgi:hypothetical protein
MANDGRRLESFVAFIEGLHFGSETSIKTNVRHHDECGNLSGEVDVEVRGKFGSTEILWIIECRDRPSDGAAPISWIEQLAARRQRLNAHKVTAVSTTGFAPAAKLYAQQEEIELREVRSLDHAEFADWLIVSEVVHVQTLHKPIRVDFIISEGEPESVRRAAADTIKSGAQNLKLKSSATLQHVHINEALAAIFAQCKPQILKEYANDPCNNVRVLSNYPNPQDHFLLTTVAGDVRILSIDYRFEVRTKVRFLPLTVSQRYSDVSGIAISDTAGFTPALMGSKLLQLELHNLKSSGETHVVMTCVDDNFGSGDEQKP